MGQDGRPGAAPAGSADRTALLMTRPRPAVRGPVGRGRRTGWPSRSCQGAPPVHPWHGGPQAGRRAEPDPAHWRHRHRLAEL